LGGITWISGDTVIAGHGYEFARRLGVWSYPAGGPPLRRTRQVEKKRFPVTDINLSEPPTERLPGSIQAPREK
jgi:hypothetical protein